MGLGANVFGKDVANFQLYQALTRHAGYEQVDILSVRHATDAEATKDLLEGAPCATRVAAHSILAPAPPVAAGTLLRGQPDLENLAWMRRRTAHDRAYSLVGLAHTLAPPAGRHIMAQSLIAPTFPWDAIICTSPSVRQSLEEMFGQWGDFLAERTGGGQPPRPSLPVVPLGVDTARFAGLADRPEVRARKRAEFGLGEADVLVLWVGRLSWFEKAFPQSMFMAVQQAAKATGVRVAFAMAGWFPGEGDRPRYEELARRHAPDVDVRFLDGNDTGLVGDLWAAGDIFLSLVDNIQETFGITPIEAMAAGMPVVASSWDGYRSTVRDGVDGFLIRTLLPPGGGLGGGMSLRHIMMLDTYQSYVGKVAQHTAVHVGRAAQALEALIRSPDLRRRMGASGRARVLETFDWPVVARQLRSVMDELGEVRAASPQPQTRHAMDPIRGDPFAEFRHFPTEVLELDMPLRIVPGRTKEQVLASDGLDLAFDQWRGTVQEAAEAFDLLARGEVSTVRELLMKFPPPRRRMMELSLVWLAKMNFVDWPTQS